MSKFIGSVFCLLFFIALICAAPNPGGKASFHSLTAEDKPLKLLEAKVGSNVSAPYPTNRWFNSAYIYSIMSRDNTDAKEYNKTFSFKMSPRPLSFTWNTARYEGKGYLFGVENIRENNKPDRIANMYDSSKNWENVYDMKVTALKTDNSAPEISSDYTRLDDYSDWSATIFCKDKNGTSFIKTTIGKGFIFTYNYYSADLKPCFIQAPYESSLTFFDKSLNPLSNTSFADDRIMVKSSQSSGNFNYYGIYTSSTAVFQFWTSSFTITFPAGLSESERYVSIGLLISSPSAAQDMTVKDIFDDYYKYAYNFITDTEVSYAFNGDSSKLTTNFNFDIKEKRQGDPSYNGQQGTIIAVFPHQYNKNAITSVHSYGSQEFQGLRGKLKILKGVSSFQTEYIFNGVLPNLPFEVPSSKTAKLQEYIEQEKNFNPAGDNRNTYYAGKALSKAANLIPVFNQAVSYNAANRQIRNDMITKLKNLLSTWYGGKANDKYFGYNTDNGWYGIMGHPAGFGLENFNDHNFHYGYFVYASAILAMFDPSFALASEYKGMVDLLIKDYANPPDSTDSNFPILRCFDVYEGHSWASGFDPSSNDGVNQESSSEAMNAWAAIILWGMATNNQKFIDLGVYGYTTEYAAIREYYFDTKNVNLTPYKDGYFYDSVGILYDNSIEYRVLWRYPYDKSNPYTQEVKGIQVLPLTPSMLYLGYDTGYAASFYSQLSKTHGALINNPNWWKSVLLRFKALFTANDTVVNEFESGSFPNEDEGSSLSFSYQFIHFFNSLGRVDTDYYAKNLSDNPKTPSFLVMNKGGVKTFIAFNESTSTYKNVEFHSRTSGLQGTMEVPPMTMVSSTNSFTFFKYDSLRTILVSSQNYVLLADKYADNIVLSSCPVPFSDNSYYIDVQNAFNINLANADNVTAFVKVDSATVSSGYTVDKIKLYRYDEKTQLPSPIIPVQSFKRTDEKNNILIRANLTESGKYVLAIPTGLQPLIISGTIKNAKDNSDIEITLYAYDTVTNSSSTQSFNGNYAVVVDSNSSVGRYIYTPVNADYTFAPANFTNTASDQTINIIASRINTKVFAYPNPYKASRHGASGITFANTQAGDRIRIYTIAGEKVFDKTAGSADFKWELVNDYNYYIASGVYIYYIESQGKTYKGKIAVER
ncbi:MAG: T9SS type A sorting domain-containing protein [Endomicrobium sp.]|nr:T9SS type A sorting domain-containing protein [Endomicrobium sp.]